MNTTTPLHTTHATGFRFAEAQGQCQQQSLVTSEQMRRGYEEAARIYQDVARARDAEIAHPAPLHPAPPAPPVPAVPAVNAKQVGGTHYTGLAVQPWAAMEAWLTPEQFKGFLHGNAIKYLARANGKGDPLGDVRKAAHYLDKLVDTLEGGKP